LGGAEPKAGTVLAGSALADFNLAVISAFEYKGGVGRNTALDSRAS
jgi:hypothetical protein